MRTRGALQHAVRRAIQHCCRSRDIAAPYLPSTSRHNLSLYLRLFFDKLADWPPKQNPEY